MTDDPLITVVTPSYNQGRFIEETIQSVLGQGYPRLEYLVMDGGSKDDTVDVLKKYGDRLRWVSEKDGGQADAVNKGFAAARGEILGWLNSDDTYAPGALRAAADFFAANPDVGMVYGDGDHVDEGGRFLERYPARPYDWKALGDRCYICQPAAFIRAEVFRQVGPLDGSLHFTMDYDYWIRVGKRFKVAYRPGVLARSRLHGDTKTVARRADAHDEALATLRRHYGRAPLHWICAAAFHRLAPGLLPGLAVPETGGWAGAMLRHFLLGRGRWYADPRAWRFLARFPVEVLRRLGGRNGIIQA